jgi:zinc protease
MKKVLLFTLCIAYNHNAFAQAINLEMPIPEEQSIKKGVLENGMTYYIHDTKVTKDVASYYIIQNNKNEQAIL